MAHRACSTRLHVPAATSPVPARQPASGNKVYERIVGGVVWWPFHSPGTHWSFITDCVTTTTERHATPRCQSRREYYPWGWPDWEVKPCKHTSRTRHEQEAPAQSRLVNPSFLTSSVVAPCSGIIFGSVLFLLYTPDRARETAGTYRKSGAFPSA